MKDDHFLIKTLLASPIAFHKIFADISGSVTAGLMLSQAFYWSDGKMHDPDGWIFKSAAEWTTETALTTREQQTARTRLRKFDWWEEKLKKANGAPTMHYRLDLPGLLTQISKHCGIESDLANRTNPFGESDKTDLANRTNPFGESDKTLTETTSETTSEITTTGEGQPGERTEPEPADDPSPPPTATVEEENPRTNFDGDCGPPQYPSTGTEAPGKITKRRQITSRLYDPRKFRDGFCPSGAGDTPYEVYREQSNHQLRKPSIEWLSEEITDLSKWRGVVTEYIRRGYNPMNTSNMVKIYHEGWNENGTDIRTNGRNSTEDDAKRSEQIEQFTALNRSAWRSTRSHAEILADAATLPPNF